MAPSFAAFSRRRGRRPALVAAFMIGACGAAVAAFGGQMRWVWLLLVGMVMFGGVQAASLQGRFVAADLAEPGEGPRAIAAVVWIGTLGAVFGSGASVFASAVAVFFERPRPPRLPRRRLGLVLLDCPASAAGSVLRGSGASGAAASRGACSSDFLDRNQRKKNLLRARALRQRRLGRRRGACAAGCGRWKTSAHRVPTGPAGPAVRSRT